MELGDDPGSNIDQRSNAAMSNTIITGDSIDEKENLHGDKENKKGKKRQKIFSGQLSCKCDKNCAERIDILRQKELFDEFYTLKTFSERTNFLRHNIGRVKIENVYLSPLRSRKKKQHQHIYFLQEGDGVEQVCMSFFSKLFQLNRNTIYNAIRSEDTNPEGYDRRGKFPKRKIPVKDIELIKEFVGEFQSYESRFSSRRQTKRLLHPKLNFIRLYKQYKDMCAFRKRKPVSKQFFKKIFMNDFDLVVGKRNEHKKCIRCLEFNRNLKKPISKQERSNLKLKKIRHMKLVRKVNRTFTTDIEKAREMENPVEILTFEMCKPFDLPSISENNEIMKKRQLWQFVMLIHDEIRQRSHVYTWPECIASKGSSEITSVIRKHLKENLSKHTKKLILYCDPLSGQNRNLKISLMLKHFLHSWSHTDLQIIEQRFFVSGHAKNRCNLDFCIIEKRKKEVQNIFVPHDCLTIINESKKTEPRFYANEMLSQDFFALHPLLNLLNGSKNLTDIKKINLLRQQTIRHDRDNPFVFIFKDYNSSEVEVPLSLNISDTFESIELPPLFPEGRAISKMKYDDLQYLIKFIPAEHHDFYTKLKYDSINNPKDFALSLKESSDEED